MRKIDWAAKNMSANIICGASFEIDTSDFVMFDSNSRYRSCYLYFYGTAYSKSVSVHSQSSIITMMIDFGTYLMLNNVIKRRDSKNRSWIMTIFGLMVMDINIILMHV